MTSVLTTGHKNQNFYLISLTMCFEIETNFKKSFLNL